MNSVARRMFEPDDFDELMATLEPLATLLLATLLLAARD